jgi:RNA polymerase sigma-70 factor (ECF subfamily)
VDLVQRFDADRRHLRSVAFQLLGSVADADDAVQAAWLKATRHGFDALLVVLDRLSPSQRVALVLHDVFAMPFEKIAALLDRSPAAAKKLASRAGGRLHARPAVETSRAAEHLAVVEGFAQRARAGSVLLIAGAQGIVIAPHGRAQALLRIGFGADNRIHSIDITGAPDRLRRAVLALPSRPSQQHHSPIGYQGHRRQPARPPATGQHRERHAR